MRTLRSNGKEGTGGGVDHAEVSHESGTAVVYLKSAVSDAELKKAVEKADYEVTGISG